jgi:hypothetical protein
MSSRRISRLLVSSIDRAQDQTKFFGNFRSVRKTEFVNRIGQELPVDLLQR